MGPDSGSGHSVRIRFYNSITAARHVCLAPDGAPEQLGLRVSRSRACAALRPGALESRPLGATSVNPSLTLWVGKSTVVVAPTRRVSEGSGDERDGTHSVSEANAVLSLVMSRESSVRTLSFDAGDRTGPEFSLRVTFARPACFAGPRFVTSAAVSPCGALGMVDGGADPVFHPGL